MVSEAQRRASDKYNKEHYKRIPFNVTFEDYNKIKTAADKLDMSVNGFIRATVLDKIDDLQGYFSHIE